MDLNELNDVSATNESSIYDSKINAVNPREDSSCSTDEDTDTDPRINDDEGRPAPLPPPAITDNAPPPSYDNPIVDKPRPSLLIRDYQGMLPSYLEAVDPSAPPPSYDSIFGRVRKAHSTKKGIVDFCVKVITIFLGSCGYSFLMGSTFLLPLSMIAIGSVFIYQCPAAPYIPIYILVGGSLGLMMQVLYICDHLKPLHRSRQSDASITSKTSSGLTFLTYLMLTWFIMGSPWVYQIYEPNYSNESTHYCDKTLYLFTFWLVTVTYGALGMIAIFIFAVYLISISFQYEPTNHLG